MLNDSSRDREGPAAASFALRRTGLTGLSASCRGSVLGKLLGKLARSHGTPRNWTGSSYRTQVGS